MVLSTSFPDPGKAVPLEAILVKPEPNQRLHAKGWFKMYETVKLESNWFFNRYRARPCVFKRYVLPNVGMLILGAVFFPVSMFQRCYVSFVFLMEVSRI